MVSRAISRVALSVIQTLGCLSDSPMSRASISQHPLRTDDHTPDLDERTRKKVRWNSDNVMEGDKEGELEDSSDDAKVGLSPLYISTPLVT